MKKLALNLSFLVFCAGTLGASGPDKPATAALSRDNAIGRPQTELTFNQLLGQLVIASLDTITIPEPGLDKDLRAAASADERYWVTVLASDKYERTRLLEAGMDIVEVGKNKVSGFVHKKTLAVLSEKGFVIESKMSMAQYIQQFGKDFPVADAAYHNFKETTELLKSLASNNPEMASLFSIGRTIEGRDIWCLRINTSAKGGKPSAKPGAVYVGNHHAREHLSNEVPLLFAAWLFDHKNDADIRKYLAELDIYIIPMLNPDGVEFDIKTGKYQWQRKNMRVNADKTIGVDLNRNYDFLFGGEGSSHSPYSDTYCGPAAFSEPESQAIKKFVESRRNLKTFISYHSYGSTILYPWGGKDENIPDAKDLKVFQTMSAAMGKLTNYTSEKSSDLYVSTGDTCDWVYQTGKIFALTFELEGNGFYPGAAAITRAVAGNVKAAVYMLSITDNPYKIIQ